jgi:hypothetical protein
MSQTPISQLRGFMIEDMCPRKFGERTRHSIPTLRLPQRSWSLLRRRIVMIDTFKAGRSADILPVSTVDMA